MTECFSAILVSIKLHFKKFLGTLPLYSLDKRNDKVVGCLGLIYNLIKLDQEPQKNCTKGAARDLSVSVDSGQIPRKLQVCSGEGRSCQ